MASDGTGAPPPSAPNSPDMISCDVTGPVKKADGMDDKEKLSVLKSHYKKLQKKQQEEAEKYEEQIKQLQGDLQRATLTITLDSGMMICAISQASERWRRLPFRRSKQSWKSRRVTGPSLRRTPYRRQRRSRGVPLSRSSRCCP